MESLLTTTILKEKIDNKRARDKKVNDLSVGSPRLQSLDIRGEMDTRK
jgi:hypothetical protein